MCFAPALMLGLASGALSIGQTIMQVQQANSTAEAMAESANRAAQFDYQLLAQRRQQIGEKYAIDAMERKRQAVRERGKILVAAGEAGVLGGSLSRLLENAAFQGDYDTDILEANRDAGFMDTHAQSLGVYAQTQSRINQAESMVISPLQAMLSIAGAGFSGGMSGYTTGKQLWPGSSGGSLFPSKGLQIPYFGTDLEYNNINAVDPHSPYWH